MTSINPTIINQFAPTGKLRVGINLGNPILAGEDPVTKEAFGVSVDLARELAKKLNIDTILTSYQKASDTIDSLKNGDSDLIFVAIDPIRGKELAYSPAYIQIEGAYMVRDQSDIRSNDEVDQEGNHIVVGKGSAYDLHLTRELKKASIIRANSSQDVLDDFMNSTYEVAAGVKQQLEMDAKRYNNLRMLPGRFMVINQAMAVAKNRTDAAQYLEDFIREVKNTHFIQNALIKHNIQGATVAE
jgi:polar amino acid transport system substrate-binding protein